MALYLTLFMAKTIQWPLVGDISLIHYGCSLMSHGMSPYRDIVEINMPGSYFVDWTVIHILGPGAIAGRIFDFSLFIIACVAMVVIARPYDWFAGFYAAAAMLAIHGRDGLLQTGQRDLTVAVLLIAGCAFLFEALRQNIWWLCIFFGLCAGMATTIKPTVIPFGLGLLALAVFTAYRRQKPYSRYLAAGLIGMALPLLAALCFLIREHAVAAFVNTLHTIVPMHVNTGHLSRRVLLLHGIPSIVQPLAALWFALVIMTRRWTAWEDVALLAGVAFGMASFVLQAKGFPYHYYPEEAFLLLAAGIVFTTALRQQGHIRWIGIAGLVLGALWLVPKSSMQAIHYDWRNQEFQVALQSDLQQLGGSALSGQVQCMDFFAGCVNVLYNAKLVQSTGTLYDCYLLAPDRQGVAFEYRRRFWDALHAHQPRIIIVTNQACFDEKRTFDKFRQWPEFQKYLDTNYAMYRERTSFKPLPWWTHALPPSGYRIYVLHR